jgi:hypothetical protein
MFIGSAGDKLTSAGVLPARREMSSAKLAAKNVSSCLWSVGFGIAHVLYTYFTDQAPRPPLRQV